MGLFFIIGENVLAFDAEEVARAHEAVKRLGSQRAAAEELGISRSALQRRLYSANDDFLERKAQELGFDASQVSSYWAKSSEGSFHVKRPVETFDLASEIKASLADDLPIAAPVKCPTIDKPNLLNGYFITDYHLAMKAWAEETRKDDWDLKIAEKLLIDWFSYSIANSPDADEALFAQMGDWTHWDSMNTVTPGHGHQLDGDSRSQLMVRVSLRLTRKIIEMLLQKHKKVSFYNLTGNHDEYTGGLMREVWTMHYENEPRLFVDQTPDLYHAHEHGDVSLFLHHGHKRDLNNIDHVLASRFREIYGRTKFSYAHTGHKHSHQIKETNLMKIEQHPTLAPEDAYASFGGWGHKKEASVITYHKNFGEVSRLTITPEMLQ